MTIDLIALINAAFTHTGCADKVSRDLDQHAAVELQFQSIPNILIEKTHDGAVVLYCCLSGQAQAMRAGTPSQILDIVAPKAPWARQHSVSLLTDDGELYLTAVVADHCLRDGEGFSVALDGFYERVHHLCEACST